MRCSSTKLPGVPVAYSYLKLRVEAAEIVQDCFRKIWKKHQQLHEGAPLKSYLFTTAPHAILSQLRRSQHQQRSAPHSRLESGRGQQRSRVFMDGSPLQDRDRNCLLPHSANPSRAKCFGRPAPPFFGSVRAQARGLPAALPEAAGCS